MDPAAQGHGAGRTLVHAAVRFGQQRQCTTAMLTSSTTLTAALRLYESVGFPYRPVPKDVPYRSVDVYMELDRAGWLIPRATRRSSRGARRGLPAPAPRRAR